MNNGRPDETARSRLCPGLRDYGEHSGEPALPWDSVGALLDDARFNPLKPLTRATTLGVTAGGRATKDDMGSGFVVCGRRADGDFGVPGVNPLFRDFTQLRKIGWSGQVAASERRSARFRLPLPGRAIGKESLD